MATGVTDNPDPTLYAKESSSSSNEMAGDIYGTMVYLSYYCYHHILMCYYYFV